MFRGDWRAVNSNSSFGAKQGGVDAKKESKTSRGITRGEGSKLVGLIKQLQREIDAILEKEDMKWKQSAMENWLQNGDRNTKF